MATRIELKEQLSFWQEVKAEQQAAYLAILKGGVKQYRLNDRELTRLDLPELEQSMKYADSQIADIQANLNGQGCARRFVPRW